MRLFNLLSVPVTLASALGLATAAHAIDVDLIQLAGAIVQPPDVMTQPAKGVGQGGIHVEANGCSVSTDGGGFVDLQASAMTATHQMSTACGVTVTAVNCRMGEGVAYVLSAEHSFRFDSQIDGNAPDIAVLIEGRSTSLGLETNVAYSSSSDYQVAPPPPPPSKKHPYQPALLGPTGWIQTGAVDTLSHTNDPAGAWVTQAGVPLFDVSSDEDLWVDLELINAAAPKAVRHTVTRVGKLMCGATAYYSGSVGLTATMSVDNLDDTLAGTHFNATAAMSFSVRKI